MIFHKLFHIYLRKTGVKACFPFFQGYVTSKFYLFLIFILLLRIKKQILLTKFLIMRKFIVLICLLISLTLVSTDRNNITDTTCLLIDSVICMDTIIVEINKDSLLELEINQIDTRNLREIYDVECAIDSIKQMFPVLKDKEKFKQRELKDLIALCRLRPVWEYLECKGTPKFISISFFIEETGWGKSILFRKYFNLGGVKARKGQRAVWFIDDCDDPETLDTIERCPFRRYESLVHGVTLWNDVLRLPRYLENIKDLGNYEDWVTAYAPTKVRGKGCYWGSPNGKSNRLRHINKLKLNEV